MSFSEVVLVIGIVGFLVVFFIGSMADAEFDNEQAQLGDHQ